jgi:hypothetical protein
LRPPTLCSVQNFPPRKVFPEVRPLKTSANIFKFMLASGKIFKSFE